MADAYPAGLTPIPGAGGRGASDLAQYPEEIQNVHAEDHPETIRLQPFLS